MSFRKNLMCVGAGLVLTACGGGGGGDGLGGSSYDNEIVVRVLFEDGPDFDNVAAVNGDYSELTVTFDVDGSHSINLDDVRVFYRKEYVGASHIETMELQWHNGVSFLEIPDAVRSSFNSDTFEWVIDTEILEYVMDESPVIDDTTMVRVDARKDSAAFLATEDTIPNFAGFTLLEPEEPYEDDLNDMDPSSGGTTAVDMRSVRVLFFD